MPRQNFYGYRAGESWTNSPRQAPPEVLYDADVYKKNKMLAAYKRVATLIAEGVIYSLILFCSFILPYILKDALAEMGWGNFMATAVALTLQVCFIMVIGFVYMLNERS